jgi:hypothetical protein
LEKEALVGHVLRLLPQLLRPPGEPLPPGATGEQIDRLADCLGFPPPPELEHWLRCRNGPCVGPGGVYGIETARDFLDIRGYLALYPEWRERGWIPIAGNGTGDRYVVDALQSLAPSQAVYFVDCHESTDEPAYVVASGVWRFLAFLFEKELGSGRAWPFTRDYVLERDPEVGAIGDELLPW